jgi:predicted TIM-barrel fold metal-dependent hydrolase
LLFGTDHPFWDPRDAIKTVRALEWPPDELLALLGGNAERLLKLPVPVDTRIEART